MSQPGAGGIINVPKAILPLGRIERVDHERTKYFCGHCFPDLQRARGKWTPKVADTAQLKVVVRELTQHPEQPDMTDI